MDVIIGNREALQMERFQLGLEKKKVGMSKIFRDCFRHPYFSL